MYPQICKIYSFIKDEMCRYKETISAKNKMLPMKHSLKILWAFQEYYGSQSAVAVQCIAIARGMNKYLFNALVLREQCQVYPFTIEVFYCCNVSLQSWDTHKSLLC